MKYLAIFFSAFFCFSQAAPALASDFAFRCAKWGMSREEVLACEREFDPSTPEPVMRPQKEAGKVSMVLEMRAFDAETLVQYEFTQPEGEAKEALSGVVVGVLAPAVGRNSLSSTYEAFRLMLSKKYGPPDVVENPPAPEESAEAKEEPEKSKAGGNGNKAKGKSAEKEAPAGFRRYQWHTPGKHISIMAHDDESDAKGRAVILVFSPPKEGGGMSQEVRDYLSHL